MRPALTLGLSLYTLAFGACEQGSQNQSGTQAAIAGGQNISAAAGVAISIPQFQYPEQFDLQISRELRIFNSAGLSERFEENLHSDGAGQLALLVENHAATGIVNWSAPSAQLLGSYNDRQSYLVKYRDLHLGSNASLHRNFRWSEQPGVVLVAGISCKQIHAHSVEGLGDFDFLAAVSTNLLLGWTAFDSLGHPVMKLETTAVNFSVNHSSVLWASAAVPEHPYLDVIDEPNLGFTPIIPQYLPPGFYLLEKRLLLANAVLAGLGNIHATLYSDGIHLLFVAQQKIAGPPGLSMMSGPSLAKFATVGGIGVVEGDFPGVRAYVIGQLPIEELQTIFGSLF